LLIARLTAAALVGLSAAGAANTIEIKGRVTSRWTRSAAREQTT
jgi:hypothetical protein